MKRLLLLVSCCIMLGCTSIDNKAQKLVNNFVEGNFNDPELYELVEIKVDTLKDYFLLPEIYTKATGLYEMFDKVSSTNMGNTQKEIIKHTRTRNQYLGLGAMELARFENSQAIEKSEELVTDMKKYIDLAKELDSLKNNTQINELRYIIYHKYRYGKVGEKILEEGLYLTNSKIDKVEYEYDAYEYEMIKVLLNDLQTQIEGLEYYYETAMNVHNMLLEKANL